MSRINTLNILIEQYLKTSNYLYGWSAIVRVDTFKRVLSLVMPGLLIRHGGKLRSSSNTRRYQLTVLYLTTGAANRCFSNRCECGW